MSRRGNKFAFFVCGCQVVFLFLFAFLAKYDESAQPEYMGMERPVTQYYPMFQDVHVMIFIGFGFLMTFLKLYGYSAVGINFLLASFVIQLAIIVRGFIHSDIIGGDRFPVKMSELLSADFAAATVLISFGAMLGKASPLQLLVMAIIETILAQLNEHVGLHFFNAADVGEGMFIHLFGAYFGLAVARVLYSEDAVENEKEGSVYHSDLFSILATIFLWLYWPSFNGGAAVGDEQHRAVINTYLSLAACCVMTFCLSAMMDKKGRFDMVLIQNATLAGGVTVGTTANMPLEPWGAILSGCLGSIVCVLGYKFLTPFMARRLKIHDTCGVHNLHGMTGLMTGISGVIMAARASPEEWGDSMCEIFPARANNGTACDSSIDKTRSASEQALFQLATVGVSLAIAIGGGLVTGLVLKLPIWDMPQGEMVFDDKVNWEVADYNLSEVKEHNTKANGDTDATRL